MKSLIPRDNCPNCGHEAPGLYVAVCRFPRAALPTHTCHCGCYYEADPSEVKHHWRRDRLRDAVPA